MFHLNEINLTKVPKDCFCGENKRLNTKIQRIIKEEINN